MEVKIYLSNLAKYVEGRENGKWITLPMDSEKLQAAFNEIVGEKQEGIILDYESPFVISEYEDVFALNETIKKIMSYDISEDEIEALFKVNSDRQEVIKAIENGSYIIIDVDEISEGWNVFDQEELYGLVLNEAGYNNLFSQPIPEEMIDYMDFTAIYRCLSINDGWKPVIVNNSTYLVTM